MTFTNGCALAMVRALTACQTLTLAGFGRAGGLSNLRAMPQAEGLAFTPAGLVLCPARSSDVWWPI